MGWYIDEKSEPLFPFGFGLSYTSFEYSNLRITPSRAAAGANIAVSADITNTGARGGDEIVQMYVEDVICSFTTPLRRLVGFQRVSLDPKQTKAVTFELGAKAFEALDGNLRPRIEAGEFKITVAPNSAGDAGLTGSISLG
jgi:beta-glucosidase